MRFLKLLLLMALPALDDFAGGAGALSGNWTQQKTTVTVNRNGSGQATSSSGTDEGFGFWNADSFPSNQYSRLTNIQGLSSSAGYAQVTVCCSPDVGNAAFDDYVAYSDGTAGAGHTEIAKHTNGTAAVLKVVSTAFGNGDTMELQYRNGTLYLLKNGVVIDQVADATYTSGAAGFGIYGNTTAESWTGGAIAVDTGGQLFPESRLLIPCRPFTGEAARLAGRGNPLREQRYEVATAAAGGSFDLLPDVGSLVLDGFSPSIGLPVTVVTQIGALDLTGFAPKFPTTIVAQQGQLTFTGFEPTLGLPKTIVPGFGQLTLTGNAPTFPRTIVPGSGVLTLSGFSPQFALTIKTALGALALDGFAPSLSFISGGFTLQPGLGALSLTGFSPAIGLPRTLRPDVGSLTLSGFSPAIGLPYTLRPSLGQLTLTGFGPAISVTPLGLFVTPGTGQLVLTGYTPQFGSFTFRFTGGPVLTATITAGGVLVASITGGPVLTGTFDGEPV